MEKILFYDLKEKYGFCSNFFQKPGQTEKSWRHLRTLFSGYTRYKGFDIRSMADIRAGCVEFPEDPAFLMFSLILSETDVPSNLFRAPEQLRDLK
jgi:hypothetical protein